MSNTISGGISFSGIGSGTDFAAMIEQLREVESFKLYGLEDSREKANESYEAYLELIDTVTEAKEALNLLNSPSKFLTKIASSSNEAMLGVEATSEAVDGTHKIQVTQLASNAIWANKNTFAEKTSSINTTATAQDFSYTYMGETRTLSVQPGTTLESFVNMVNNDRSNPGVKLSIVKTGDGYSFQASGKDSGADATLEIHASGLAGLSGEGAIWRSTSAVDIATPLNAGETINQYSYTIKLNDSTEFVTDKINGDASQQKIVDKINAKYQDKYSTTDEIAFLVDGVMTISNLQEITTNTFPADGSASSSTSTSITPTTSFSIAGDLTATITGAAIYTFENSRGEEVKVEFTEDHTQKDILNELNERGYTVEAKTESDVTSGTIKGITNMQEFLDLATSGTATSSTTWPDYTKTIDVNAAVQDGVVPASMTWTFVREDGSRLDVDVDSSESISQALQGTGISYSQDDEGRLIFENVSAIEGVPAAVGLSGALSGSNAWEVQAAQDAIFKVDNWPQEITSSTNEVKDVIEGVTMTLRDVGTAQFTVASDVDSVKDNIQASLDAINSVLKKIQDLTAVTEEISSTYTESGTEEGTMQGSALTGDYSINLFSSRLKAAIGDQPPGFLPMDPDDFFAGDFVSALSQIGIKVSAEVDSPDFGLFVIAPYGSTDEIQALDQALFDDAIANHLDDVIAFFSNSEVGRSSSADFRYSNHVVGLTQPGTYDVTYEVSGGAVVPNSVYINGELASLTDATTNTYTAGSTAGDAGGISIVIDNLSSNGTVTGSVSIQQGKVNQMIEFFEAELKYIAPTVGDPTLGEENGGLMIAKESYADMIQSFDDQITEEMERLDRWEYTQKLKYARLDTLLGSYSGQMEILTQQISQLSS